MSDETELIRLRQRFAYVTEALAEEKAANDRLCDALLEIGDAYNDAAPHGQYERFDDYRFGITLHGVLNAVGL